MHIAMFFGVRDERREGAVEVEEDQTPAAPMRLSDLPSREA